MDLVAPLPLPSPSPSSVAVLKRLVQEEVLQHKFTIACAVACMIIAAATTASSAYLIDPAIKDIFLEKRQDMLYTLPLVVVAVSFLRGASQFGQAMLMGNMGQKVVAQLQMRMFKTLMAADLAWIQGQHTSLLVNRFVNDATRIRDAASHMLVVLIRDILTLIALAGVMIYQDWQLALIALFILLPLALGVKRLTKRSRKAVKAIFDETGTLSVATTEVLAGTRMVRIYGQESAETTRVHQSIQSRVRHLRRALMSRALSSPLTETLTGIGFGGAIFYAGYRGLHAGMELNQFMSFVTAMMMAYQPGRSLTSMAGNLQEALEACVRVYEVIDTRPRILNAPQAVALATVTGDIVFQAVSFRYEQSSPLLTNLSLHLKAGETVALVGASGSGKSTIMNLIPRFYDVSHGSITLDGHDIRDLTLESLRRHIALVSQDPFLFEGTVRENVLYGAPHATEEQLWEALDNAAAADFVRHLPQGLETPVGQGGGKLSGGQRQRLAIARAMIKNAPILLLDEATSALDAQSEAQVQQALQRLMKGRTVLMIAHRLSTIQEADRILYMSQGQIKEEGTHESLLAMRGQYANLFHQSVDSSSPALSLSNG